MESTINFAVLSGLSASAASIFGKLSGLPAFQDFLLVRLVFFALMLVCNAAVWTFFVKALHRMESSLIPTVISAASNYCFSALVGYLFFDEIFGLLWWSGMLFIVCGLVMILTDGGGGGEIDVRHQK